MIRPLLARFLRRLALWLDPPDVYSMSVRPELEPDTVDSLLRRLDVAIEAEEPETVLVYTSRGLERAEVTYSAEGADGVIARSAVVAGGKA